MLRGRDGWMDGRTEGTEGRTEKGGRRRLELGCHAIFPAVSLKRGRVLGQGGWPCSCGKRRGLVPISCLWKGGLRAFEDGLILPMGNAIANACCQLVGGRSATVSCEVLTMIGRRWGQVVVGENPGDRG